VPPEVQTLNRSVFFEKKSCGSTAATDEFWGQKSLFWHPVGTGKCPQSHLHRRYRLLRCLHRLHRHLHQRCCLLWRGGSSSLSGLRALSVAMWFIFLSHDVIYMWSWAL
jgi:hypothetical protein